MEVFCVNSLVFAYRITDFALQSTEKVMQHKVSAPYSDKKCDKKAEGLCLRFEIHCVTDYYAHLLFCCKQG